MTDVELLQMLKADLEIVPGNLTRDKYLGQLISTAKKLVQTEGMTFDAESMEDCAVVVMYAAYLYRKRAEDSVSMPRMLRWALNNRIFREKVQRE